MTLALFDFDGTITTHETMPAFVRRSVGARRRFFAQFLLAPVVIGYKLGLVSGVRVRRIVVRIAYGGMPAEFVAAAGRAFARDHLSTVLREDAMRRIAWHREQGHVIVVVSGGLDVYLAPWCDEHGLELICSSLEARDGVLTGRYHGQQCVRTEKARRVRERHDLREHATVYAYGDTPEDFDLLDLATTRYYRGQPVQTVR